jgi:hypothetical protein
MGRAYRRSKKVRLLARLNHRVQYARKDADLELDSIFEQFGCNGGNFEELGFKRLGTLFHCIGNEEAMLRTAREDRVRDLIHLAGSRGVDTLRLNEIAKDLFQGDDNGYMLRTISDDWWTVRHLEPAQVEKLIEYLTTRRAPKTRGPILVN